MSGTILERSLALCYHCNKEWDLWKVVRFLWQALVLSRLPSILHRAIMAQAAKMSLGELIGTRCFSLLLGDCAASCSCPTLLKDTFGHPALIAGHFFLGCQWSRHIQSLQVTSCMLVSFEEPQIYTRLIKVYFTLNFIPTASSQHVPKATSQ